MVVVAVVFVVSSMSKVTRKSPKTERDDCRLIVRTAEEDRTTEDDRTVEEDRSAGRPRSVDVVPENEGLRVTVAPLENDDLRRRSRLDMIMRTNFQQGPLKLNL